MRILIGTAGRALFGGRVRPMYDDGLQIVIMRVLCLLQSHCSQASEGVWGMPGHTEARKAAVSCDKPGGAAHTRRSPGCRMGEPVGAQGPRHSGSA